MASKEVDEQESKEIVLKDDDLLSLENHWFVNCLAKVDIPARTLIEAGLMVAPRVENIEITDAGMSLAVTESHKTRQEKFYRACAMRIVQLARSGVIHYTLVVCRSYVEANAFLKTLLDLVSSDEKIQSICGLSSKNVRLYDARKSEDERQRVLNDILTSGSSGVAVSCTALVES
eukprot:g844.t1